MHLIEHATVTAADVMTSYPCAVQPDTLLVDAVGVMLEHGVRHLPVVDHTSALVGMLSDRDVRTAIGDPQKYTAERSGTEAQYRVCDVMSRPGTKVPYDTTLGELARWFSDERFGALPVTDRFGALIGIVSYVDVLAALAPNR